MGAFVHNRLAVAVEFEPAVVVPFARHSGNLSRRTDSSASVEDSEDGVIVVVEFGIGSIIANGCVSIDWVSIRQRNATTDDAGRFVASSFSPRLSDQVHSARIAVQVAGAGHDGIHRSVSAIDSQHLTAQSLSPFQVA